MTEVRNSDEVRDRSNGGTYNEPRRGSGGNVITVVLIAIVAIVGILFATGFWSASVKGGNLPEVSVKGGDLPKVDMDSKALVVGTSKTTVDLPKIETQKATINVPVVGVKDDK